MKSITDTLLDYENIVRDTLKVSNPALLKTGALGTLVNIFANIKYDNAIYYNKLLREMNPATATEFSSLLFHASILNYNITFGTPASMQISFLIPEYRLRESEIITYDIKRNVSFVDGSGLNYTLEEDVKIFVNNSVVTAKRYSDTEINVLEVSKVQNPLNADLNMYMVEYNGLRQYKRSFHKFNIPDYGIGETFSFSLDIPSLDDIYEIQAWIKNEANEKPEVELDDLYLLDTDNIKGYGDLSQMQIKYNKFNASQFDDNLYLKIAENQLIFTVGDGINGRKLFAGDQIIIETKLTKGSGGNVNSAEINLEDIIVSSEDEGGYSTASKTNLKVLSLSGGELGMDIKDIEDIKTEMIKKNSTRNSITSINDFEIMYTMDDGIPFVDPKFFNSQNHLFIYNIIRDTNQRIVPTNTFNIEESEFQSELFMPTKTYEGIDLISPFYYKKRFNHYTAYMVQPNIKVELKTDTSTDRLTKLQNSVGLYITYDYFERKTRLELKNFNTLYTYKLRSNKFDMELSIHNEFKQIVNQRFLDEYCLFEDDLSDIEIDIYQDTLLVMTYTSVGSYNQLVKKQDHFYYTELDILNTQDETRYVLHLPFLELNYLKLSNIEKFFTKLDTFFRVEKDIKTISFNVGTTQSFYNTIAIEPKYREYIIDKNTNGDILTTRNIIVIDLIIDKYKYSLSDYESIEELEYDMKDTIYKVLRTAEGFETEFYETLLEKEIVKIYDMIKNVDVISPKVFTTNSARIIYNAMDNKLGGADLKLFDIVNFVPPYFFFDYDSINLNIQVV
jgi:hypothetical protein